MTALDDLLAVRRLIAVLPPLPEAFLRDRVHLELLAEVSRVLGRDPFPPNVGIARLTGIPIYVDDDVPEGMLELRWPDGRIQQIRFTTDPTPSPDQFAATVAECLPPDPQWFAE